ncbi:MAG: hypothetical protein JO112_20170 [Planctomycetes bacterium]|nr:hypothetical protein [Planctomycetota bacterium]
MIGTPSAAERAMVARCLLLSGLRIGSVDEIWTHNDAWRALVTLRMCMDAIRMLVRGQHSVQASYVKAIVMQDDDLTDTPFALDEVAEFLLNDPQGRHYWDSRVEDKHFPHRCPHCDAAAFVGFLQVWCKARCAPSKTR